MINRMAGWCLEGILVPFDTLSLVSIDGFSDEMDGKIQYRSWHTGRDCAIPIDNNG